MTEINNRSKCAWAYLALVILTLGFGLFVLALVCWWLPLVVLVGAAVLIGYMKLMAYLFLPREGK